MYSCEMYRKERATQAICSCVVDHLEVVAQNEFTKERREKNDRLPTKS